LATVQPEFCQELKASIKEALGLRHLPDSAGAEACRDPIIAVAKRPMNYRKASRGFGAIRDRLQLQMIEGNRHTIAAHT
jgi:hypothetical protein